MTRLHPPCILNVLVLLNPNIQKHRSSDNGETATGSSVNDVTATVTGSTDESVTATGFSVGDMTATGSSVEGLTATGSSVGHVTGTGSSVAQGRRYPQKCIPMTDHVRVQIQDVRVQM